MKYPHATDTCECGRPEVGPAHCPVHGDGKHQPAPETPRPTPEKKKRRGVKNRPGA